MGHRLLLIIAVQMPRRLAECRIGAAANHNTILLDAQRLDMGADFIGKRLPRHASSDRHHDVDHQYGVILDDRVGIHLQVRERPAFVEHTQAHLAVASDDRALPRPAIVDTSSSSSSVGM